MQDETQAFVVGSGLTIVGDIDAAGALRVEGAVRGRVFVRGTLTVAPGAVVEGFIQALDIEVFGRLAGVVRAEIEVRLQPGGEVTGDVEAPRVRFVKSDRTSIPPPAVAPAPPPPARAQPPAPPPAPEPEREPEPEERALPPARAGHAPGALPAWPPQGLPKAAPVWAPKSGRPASTPPPPPAAPPAEEPDTGPPSPPSITGGQRQIVVRRR
jgi:hypothetical protein